MHDRMPRKFPNSVDRARRRNFSAPDLATDHRVFKIQNGSHKMEDASFSFVLTFDVWAYRARVATSHKVFVSKLNVQTDVCSLIQVVQVL